MLLCFNKDLNGGCISKLGMMPVYTDLYRASDYADDFVIQSDKTPPKTRVLGHQLVLSKIPFSTSGSCESCLSAQVGMLWMQWLLDYWHQSAYG